MTVGLTGCVAKLRAILQERVRGVIMSSGASRWAVMTSFLREVLAAMQEGPSLFFAPLKAAISMARRPHINRQS